MTTFRTFTNKKLKIANKVVSGMDDDVQAVSNMLSVVDPFDTDALSLGDLIGYNDDDTVKNEVARRIKRIAVIVAEERGINDLRMTSFERAEDRYQVGITMVYVSGVVKRGYINV